VSVARALERLGRDDATALNIVQQRIVEAQPARYGTLQRPLPEAIAQGLAGAGVARLYTHQAQAIDAARAGHDVVIVTPTASGKTLCYALPILQTLAEQPASRALLLYPTKALAHDQMDELQRLAQSAGSRARVLAYDGDTPQAQRSDIRQQASLIVTNPDMLHVSILPNHPQWRAFFAALDYVVIDELHTYRGVFGSQVGNVLRRLLRICRFYGRSPRIVCASATIANPVELAEALVGRQPQLVSESGAAVGQRHVVLYNPPLLDVALGIRRSAMVDARHIANLLQSLDLQTILFCASRGAVEQLLVYLRQDAAAYGRNPASIRGYRGGYLPQERREIEAGLRSGDVRCVVATSALELGVDIGGMAACVLVGYPGSIASTWQRIGRAGRGSEDSLAVLVASASPLDQYIMAQPDYLFQQAPERALINPDNLHVLLGQVRCAAHELPFALDEAYGREDVQQVLASLEGQGELRRGRARWHRIAGDYPAAEVALRSASPDRITIIARDAEGERVIGLVDRETAPVYVHEQAIYLHESQQYLVERLDWEGGVAHVAPVTVDYATRANGASAMQVRAVRGQEPHNGCDLWQGPVALRRQITGFRRVRLNTLETVGWGEVDLPEQVLETEAMWLTLSEEMVAELAEGPGWVGERAFSRGANWAAQRALALARDGQACRQCGAEGQPGRPLQVHHVRPYSAFGEAGRGSVDWQSANALDNLITLCPTCHRLAEQAVAVRGSLAGLGHAVRYLLPTLLLCSADDVGVLSDPRGAQTGLPTLFIYDDLPGGVGLAAEALRQFGLLVERAVALISNCQCASGCPSCIGPVLAEDGDAKSRVLALARRLAGG